MNPIPGDLKPCELQFVLCINMKLALTQKRENKLRKRNQEPDKELIPLKQLLRKLVPPVLNGGCSICSDMTLAWWLVYMSLSICKEIPVYKFPLLLFLIKIKIFPKVELFNYSNLIH